VAVFDTCDLVDLKDPLWWQHWVWNVGPSLRVLLGFASPATIEQSSTRRGRLFGERIVSGAPIGPSWLEAVHSTGYAGLDLGVAIGLGDSPNDAEWALHRIRMGDLPARRTNVPAFFALEATR
jgi:hypothetical protein